MILGNYLSSAIKETIKSQSIPDVWVSVSISDLQMISVFHI